jgi:hypothetical protein
MEERFSVSFESAVVVSEEGWVCTLQQLLKCVTLNVPNFINALGNHG